MPIPTNPDRVEAFTPARCHPILLGLTGKRKTSGNITTQEIDDGIGQQIANLASSPPEQPPWRALVPLTPRHLSQRIRLAGQGSHYSFPTADNPGSADPAPAEPG
jgi:hypothetical protein